VTARPLRAGTAIVLAVTATWFVARPALGRTDPAGGAVRWSAPMRDGPSDLAADRDGVVVTTSALSVEAFDAHGHVRWHTTVDDLAMGQPAIGPDVVVIGGSESVTALGRDDGTVRWSRPRADQVHSVAVAGDTVLVGDDSGTLAAFAGTNGEPRWSVRYPGALWSGARIDRERAVVVATWHQTDSPAVRAFDLATGALRWEAPTDQFTAAPAIHAGRVVLAIGDGDRHARVESRDLATGALQWQSPVPASFEEAIEPAVDRHAVVVVDHFGVVSAFVPATGHLRWRRDLADVLLATRVVLTGRRVALTSYQGVLHVLDRRDGREVERLMPARLGGLPVALLRAPWRPDGGVLLALRLRDWGVQLRRLA
jgi:outer membrane protein assembly factor BamB